MERESRPSRCTFSFLVVVGDALIEYLLEAGWKAVRIAEGVGCHEKTVRRLAATFRAGPENRSNERRKTDRNASPVSSPNSRLFRVRNALGGSSPDSGEVGHMSAAQGCALSRRRNLGIGRGSSPLPRQRRQGPALLASLPSPPQAAQATGISFDLLPSLANMPATSSPRRAEQTSATRGRPPQRSGQGPPSLLGDASPDRPGSGGRLCVSPTLRFKGWHDSATRPYGAQPTPALAAPWTSPPRGGPQGIPVAHPGKVIKRSPRDEGRDT